MSKKTTYELALEIGGKIQSSFEKSVGSVNKKLDSIGNAAKKAAKVASAAFAAVKVVDFAKDAVETYAEFNQAMASTSAIAGANTEEMQKLEAAALEMGKKTTKTATEATQALGYMALAGWDVETSISALEPVLRLSEATQMDLATCSDLVTDSMSALGLTVDELSGYLDVACKANNKSNQTAQQLMEAYIGCGGTLNNLNISVEDSATALGVLANRGIKGSEAGNKLNSVLINLTSGTGQAGEMMEKLGISAFDSEGNFIGLEETLQVLNKALAGLTEEERNAALAAIGGKTQIDTLNDLLSGLNTTTADGTTEWAALNAELNNAEGSMMNMAAQMTDTLSGAMAVFGSAVDDAKIRLCKIFAPMAQKAIFAVADKIPSITEKVVGMVQSFYDKAVPAVQEFKNKAIDAFEKIQPTLEDIKSKATEAFQFLASVGKTAFENLKAKIEENKPTIDKVIAVLLDLKDKFFEAFEKAEPVISYIATTAFPALVDGAMNVIDVIATVYQKLDEWGLLIPIIGGIASAVTGIKMVNFAKDTMQGVKATKALITVFATEKKAMITNLALKAKDKLETAYIYALYAKDAVIKGVSTAATWAQTAAMTAWNGICAAGTAVTTALGAAFTFLTSPIGLVILAIAAVVAIGVLLYKNWDTVKEKASQLGEWIVGVFNNLKEKVSGAIQTFADKFPAAFAFISSIFETWKQTISDVISGAKQIFDGIIQFITGVFTGDWQKALDGLKDIFSGVFEVLSSLAMAPLDTLKGIVAGAFDAIDIATGGKLTAIKDKFSEIWIKITDKVGEAWQTIKDVVQVGIMLIGEIISAAFQIITLPFQFIWQNCKDSVISAWDFIKDAVKNAIQNVTDTISSFIEPIVNVVSGAWSAVSSATSSAWTTATGYISDKLNVAKEKVSAVTDSVKTIASNAWSAVSSSVSSSWENIKNIMSNKINSAKDSVSSILTKIKSSFSSVLTDAKNMVTDIFSGIVSSIKSKMESAKSAVSDVISALKNKFNFSWSLPKLKLPHVSISGSFSISPPSVPKFGIDWYKDGGILTRPTIFGANGNSLLGGGEAGKEAVLPLSELWANMKTVVAGVISKQPDSAAAMFEKIKQLTGTQSSGQTVDSVTKQLYNTVTNNNTVNKSSEQNTSNDSQKIVFSPQITIQGNASKEDVQSALEMSQEKFNAMMAEYQRQNRRTSFA